MATVKKKKTSSIGQVSYLTKQIEGLGTELIRKDIKQLKTELTAKIDKVDSKVSTKIDNLESKNKIIFWILGSLVALFIGGFTVLSNRIDTTRIELRQDMKSLKQDINRRFDKIERAIEKLNR